MTTLPNPEHDHTVRSNSTNRDDVGGDSVAKRTTSLSLLAGLREADEAAWKRLIFVYAPLVYQWCRRWGIAAEDAADVVQDVFAAVASGIHRFRHERPNDRFRAWLWTITRNKAVDFNNRLRRVPRAEGGSDHQLQLSQIPQHYPVGDVFADEDHVALLRQALEVIRGDFQSNTWQAFWSTAIEGRSTAAIAEDLNISVRAVRQARYRILQRLREEFHVDVLAGCRPRSGD